MINRPFFLYNNMNFSKDRSVSQKLSFQPVKSRQHKKKQKQQKKNIS